MMRTPVAEVEISDDLVRRLLADQHPDLASRPLGRRIDGWDNAMFRLGHDLAVRLPRRALGAEISAAEHEHLPVISQRWTFPAPVPLRLGAPAEGFPWEWSVVPWIDGDIAFDDPLTDLGARDLGVAIAQIQQSPTAGAPHNPYRSGTLPEVAELFDTRLRALVDAGVVAMDAADVLRGLVEAGAAIDEPERRWAHLDLHGANVIVRGGRLAGIVDWGDAALADPATDLGQACTLVGLVHADALLEAYGTAEGPMRVGAGSEGRARVMARAAAYGVTLASIAEEPYRSTGLDAIAGLAWN
ncbi:phosphotransferase [uncultured Demequina sp.]|uniref:phosphotransferase n=1 Tax=uncultured Demequina sp. TaxID=693499 RepID=UPI0025DFAAC8|nr:phosphotransferase [uncultured Demequina sp.]